MVESGLEKYYCGAKMNLLIGCVMFGTIFSLKHEITIYLSIEYANNLRKWPSIEKSASLSILNNIISKN